MCPDLNTPLNQGGLTISNSITNDLKNHLSSGVIGAKTFGDLVPEVAIVQVASLFQWLYNVAYAHCLQTSGSSYLAAAYRYYELAMFSHTQEAARPSKKTTCHIFHNDTDESQEFQDDNDWMFGKEFISKFVTSNFPPLVKEMLSSTKKFSLACLLLACICTFMAPSNRQRSAFLVMLYNDGRIQKYLNISKDNGDLEGKLSILEDIKSIEVNLISIANFVEKLYLGHIVGYKDLGITEGNEMQSPGQGWSDLIHGSILDYYLTNATRRNVDILGEGDEGGSMDIDNIGNLKTLKDKKRDSLNVSLAEHNLQCATRIYKTMRFSRLKELVFGADTIEIQVILTRMIREFRIEATIDQLDEIVKFNSKVPAPHSYTAATLSKKLLYSEDGSRINPETDEDTQNKSNGNKENSLSITKAIQQMLEPDAYSFGAQGLSLNTLSEERGRKSSMDGALTASAQFANGSGNDGYFSISKKNRTGLTPSGNRSGPHDSIGAPQQQQAGINAEKITKMLTSGTRETGEISIADAQEIEEERVFMQICSELDDIVAEIATTHPEWTRDFILQNF